MGRATQCPLTRIPRHRRISDSTAAAAVGKMLVAPPPIGDELRPLVVDLGRELTRETAGRDRFVGFAAPDLSQAAETLVRYRLSTLEIIRGAKRDARRLFLNECRESGRKSFPEMQLIAQLFAHFAPMTAKSRANVKDPAYEEVVIPRKLSCY